MTEKMISTFGNKGMTDDVVYPRYTLGEARSNLPKAMDRNIKEWLIVSYWFIFVSHYPVFLLSLIKTEIKKVPGRT